VQTIEKSDQMSARFNGKMAQTSADAPSKGLESLFRTRFHGAANIRGIQYQILYSILRAFDLYKIQDETGFIRLEGLEDIDLLGLRLGNKYIQVKSSQIPWNWSKLKEPIRGFLEVHRSEPQCYFELVTNFQLQKDICKFANRESLSPGERLHIDGKFRNLCRDIGASTNEADALASRLNITSKPENQVFVELRRNLNDIFGVMSEAVDTYISVLVAKFLDWAKDRKSLTRADLDGIRIAIGEALSSESEFQAHGLGLISRVSWDLDKNLADFYDGKGTRPGHISANVDIRRIGWLEKIDSAIHSSKICVLRSSSGQGKSALLYRYAYEKWPAENTFILRAVESSDQVELIRNHLRFRANLGLPILLLIDNAGWKTRFWPLIAQECAALDIRVLISIRNEDWHRFALESLTNYEILEPILDLNEAREIFNAFKTEKKIHELVNSAEWAYENTGEPHLLIEYVYLITHGQMLEERLRDQLKQFSEHQEDPAKVEILRRVTLADALGGHVFADKLLKDIELREDPQQMLNSLAGEYLNLDRGIITGLHWIRSDHLARILHEGYPDPESTALAVIEAISKESISVFVSNAIGWKGLDASKFIKGLTEKSKNADVDTILGFIYGIFKAGENRFFYANRILFDEAYEITGSSGIFVLSSAFMPVVKCNFIAEMCDNFKDERGENFHRLREISSRVVAEKRGIDLVRDFLSSICLSIAPETLQTCLNNLGILLDWCSLCGISLPAWLSTRDMVLEYAAKLDISLSEFCSFAQGFYRYDKTAYLDWFSRNKDDIISYLKFHTNCIEIDVSDSVLSIEFFFGAETRENGNSAAMSRLNELRSAIPFCDRYQSQGIWLLPFGLKPSIDETHKDIPKNNLYFNSDIEKNVIWKETVESYYLPDSYYSYEEAWYALRKDALLFIQVLSKVLKQVIAGKNFNFQESFEEGRLLDRLAYSIKRLPNPPPQIPEYLKEFIKGGPEKWSNNLYNFLHQLFQYIGNTDNPNAGRLSVINFQDAFKSLQKMQSTFARFFEIAPDYFRAAEEMNVQENKIYPILADLLDAWISNPPKTPQRDIVRYLKIRREKKRQEMLKHLYDAIAPLKEKGMTIVLPESAYLSHPLTYLPLAFSVEDPCYFDVELAAVLGTLQRVRDIADVFCLVPLHQGCRFIEGGYRISSLQITKFDERGHLDWEALVPYKFSDSVMGRLPDIPFKKSQRFQFRSIVFLLIGTINILFEQKIKVDSMKLLKNKFHAELHARHKSGFLKFSRGLSVVASSAKNIMEDDFSSQNDQIDFKIVFDFVESVEFAVNEEGEFNESILPYRQNLEKILESTDRLLKKI
jgi:hypothetical protein